MDACIELMDRTLRALAEGDAQQPLRSVMWLPASVGLLGMMPSSLAAAGVMGVKVISVFPGNQGTAYDAHQGAVLLFETSNGRLLAVVDASQVTAIRTAAVSGVATRQLARTDAGDLAILGSGVQASRHLDAMLLVRTIRRVRVWSRNSEHCRAFAARESKRHGIAIEPIPTAREAVTDADLICTVTASAEPVLCRDWIGDGAHINAVGSCTPAARELDAAAVAAAQLFVDRRESVVNESGDFLLARDEGLVTDDHIQAELGEVLVGEHPGRGSHDEITLFKSLGLAVEDLACADFVYRRAMAAGGGTAVDLGGRRHEAD
jgi:ornithine cyclodeaminase